MGVPDGMRTSPGVRKTQFPTGGHWELLEKPIWASPGAAGGSGASRSRNRFLPTSPLFGSFLRAPCSVYLHLWHALGILLSFFFKKFWGFLDSVLHVDFRAPKNRKNHKNRKNQKISIWAIWMIFSVFSLPHSLLELGSDTPGAKLGC